MRNGVGDFKYFVGISSLAQVATRDDRVCVLNILGGESSQVTPVGHAWSGGNVVFGTSPGRTGQTLATPAGDIPVYDNVREGLEVAPNLWAGVGLVRGGAGTALVGNPQQVADRIKEYAALGLDSFILSGYPHLEEAHRFAELVFPLLPVDVQQKLPGQALTGPFGEIVANSFVPKVSAS